jgi:hypothetical protein
MSTPQSQVFIGTTQTNVITVNTPGPQGPTGPLGNPGPTGPGGGPTGPTGPSGASLAPTYGNQLFAAVPSGNSDSFSPFGYVPGTTDMLIVMPTDDTSTLLGLAASGVPNGFSLVMFNASPSIDMMIESSSSSTPANQFVCAENSTVLLEAYSKVILVYLTGYGWTT